MVESLVIDNDVVSHSESTGRSYKFAQKRNWNKEEI